MECDDGVDNITTLFVLRIVDNTELEEKRLDHTDDAEHTFAVCVCCEIDTKSVACERDTNKQPNEPRENKETQLT